MCRLVVLQKVRSSKIEQELHQVVFGVQIQSFSKTVSPYFHSPKADIEQRGNFLGREVESQVSTELQVGLSEIGIVFFQPLNKVFMSLIKMKLKLFPVLLGRDSFIDELEQFAVIIIGKPGTQFLFLFLQFFFQMGQVFIFSE